MDINKDSRLIEAAGIVYLTEENCKFTKNGDFLGLDYDKGGETVKYERVNLHRMFPFNIPFKYISVLNTDSEEIGIISSLTDFGSETEALLKKELERKYYVCELVSLISVKDRFGFSYWKAIGTDGEISFTIKDVHSSVRLDGLGNIMISDIDGNRYTLPSVDRLDSKSKKLIELYL